MDMAGTPNLPLGTAVYFVIQKFPNFIFEVVVST